MKRSIHYKLRQLVAALLMGFVGPVFLLFLFNHPANLETATFLAGWGGAALFVWFSWRRRSGLWPWRYALAIAMILAMLLQISLLLQHSSTPLAYAATITVNSLSDDTTAGDGECTLREAIINANETGDQTAGDCLAGDSGMDIINFDPISAAGTIVLTQTGPIDNNSVAGDLDINGGVTIMGLSPMSTTIDGNNLDRVFHILTNGTVRFEDLTIQNGQSVGDGGGIFNQNTATVVIDNVTIEDNEVTGEGEDGGGVANTGGGTVNIINNSVIDNNRVTNTGVPTDSNRANGGGIFNLGSGSTVNITNVTITNNSAEDDGGGVYNFNGATANITQTTTTGNTARRDGGGIYNSTGNSVVNLVGSTVSDNTATEGNAGGIYSSQNLNITQGTTIEDNTATERGGGIYNVGTMNITEGIISGNTATNDGGGIASAAGTVIILSSVISDNETLGADGGGIANRGGGTTMTINNTLIANNEAADDGGGVSNAITGTLIINTSAIIGNMADDNGGGVFNTDDNSTVNVTQSTLQNNTAADQGGGLFSDGIVVVEISTVSGNTASEGGGIAANFDGAQVGLNGVTVADNEATVQGGGIFRGADGGGGTLGFVNSLIADNIGTNDPDCSDQGGAPSPATLTSGGHNLIGDSTGCSGLLPTDLVNADPKLGPLADNGFSTQTHALLVGSEAIDAGDDVTCKSTDQRLESRVDQTGVGTANCDIGAFEFTPSVDVPALAINDVTLDEGDSGSQTMSFEVTLTGPQPFTATVDYDITAGTAVGNVDYVDTSGTLTFDPSTQSRTVDVTINGDSTPEEDETFTVNLSNANWATISDNQGNGIITNDDVGVSISDAEVEEGDEGLTDVVLDVTLSLDPDTTVIVDYNTADGTAEAGVDYVSKSDMLTFTSGITQQQITIQVIGDTEPDEGDEIFRVNLSVSSGEAELVKGLGQVTILENDFTDIFVFLPTIIK